MRESAVWGGNISLLLILLRPKLECGLEKCLNAINEKVFYFSTKNITEEGLNSLMALAETGLNICKNKSPSEKFCQVALERVDIGQLFQHQLLTKEPKVRPFSLAMLELYFLLLDCCSKAKLKIKFITHFALQVTRLIDHQNDVKFTGDVISIVMAAAERMKPEEKG